MSPHANFLQRRPLAEAVAMLLAGVEPVAAESVAVDDAHGRVAAETVRAARPSPHYRASAMDGLAVRARDTWKAADSPVRLAAQAASDAAPPDGAAACVPVDTGALLPAWADAVVRIEDATADGDGFRIRAAVAPGADVRREGEDLAAGAVIVREGQRLRAWDLGALLATGTTSLRVRRRPRVAILATGGEVVEPTGEARPGQVVEYNSRVLAARLEEWGAVAHRLGLVPDDAELLRHALADAAARFDAVCVIAGSSAGRRDLTVAALRELGDVFVHGIDIAPGRPAALARIEGSPDRPARPVVAIPGYPVAAVVVGEEIVRPLVAALLGTSVARRPSVPARVARHLPSRLGLEEFRRVVLVHGCDGGLVAAPLPSGAGSIRTVTTAHGWIRIGAAVEGLDSGAAVDVELLVPMDEVEAALVVAGPATARTDELEAALRAANPSARVVALGLGPADAAAALARGEAHAAEGGGGPHAAEGGGDPHAASGAFEPVPWPGATGGFLARRGSVAARRIALAAGALANRGPAVIVPPKESPR